MSEGVPNSIAQICSTCGKDHTPNIINDTHFFIFCAAGFEASDSLFAELFAANQQRLEQKEWPEIIE